MTHKKIGRVFKQKRQHRAAERASVPVNADPIARLTELDERLGAGVGATKERARLTKKIADVK